MNFCGFYPIQHIFIWTFLNAVFLDVIGSSGKWYSSINRSIEADLNNVACPIQPIYTLSSLWAVESKQKFHFKTSSKAHPQQWHSQSWTVARAPENVTFINHTKWYVWADGEERPLLAVCPHVIRWGRVSGQTSCHPCCSASVTLHN